MEIYLQNPKIVSITELNLDSGEQIGCVKHIKKQKDVGNDKETTTSVKWQNHKNKK